MHRWPVRSLRRKITNLKAVACVGGQSGPIASFLRPVPPAQPEAEARSQATLLAAAAAAAAVQQVATVQPTVQICLTPAAGEDNGEGALRPLAKPWLTCPADMRVEQLLQASLCQYFVDLKLNGFMHLSVCLVSSSTNQLHMQRQKAGFLT